MADGAEDGSAEFPMREDEYDEDVVKSLKKQVADLKKSQAATVEEQARSMAEGMLKSQGWQKESDRKPRIIRGAARPQTIGPSDSSFLQKSLSRDEVLDEMSKLSWREISELHIKHRAGMISDLPTEVVG
jgi:hypothetical protein